MCWNIRYLVIIRVLNKPNHKTVLVYQNVLLDSDLVLEDKCAFVDSNRNSANVRVKVQNWVSKSYFLTWPD